jgi:DNA ligase-1
MKYQTLVDVYERLEGTTKRLEKTKIIADFIKRVPDSELEPILLLLQGRVTPLWDETKLGVASKLVIRALALTSGKTLSQVETEWKKTGDLGLVAEKFLEKKSQSTLFSQELSLKKVFDNIKKLSTLVGSGTVDQKVKLISELLSSAKPKEGRYIIRTALEDLRVGVASGSMRDAIVWAYLYDPNYADGQINPETRESYNKVCSLVQDAFNLTNDYATVALAAKKGEKYLEDLPLEVGAPIQVMLAQKETTLEDAFSRVGRPAALEFKYDGFRMVIHKQESMDCKDGEAGKDGLSGKKNAIITIYTRRLEQVTAQFPEVVNYVREYIKGSSFILDGEAVGFDAKTNQYLPFQSISQRIRRKYDIIETAKKFPVELNLFDILSFEGKNLIKEPFQKRRAILERIVTSKSKKIVLAKQIITSNETEAKKFFDESVKEGNEGIMFKTLDAPYKPGSRVCYMVKFKSAMETLDLAIVGAEWGEGKRKGWLTSFTLACKDGDDFLEIGKVGTGVKELEEEGLSFTELTEMLKPKIISEKGKEVRIKPYVILEIKFEEIQKSTSYGSGYALRFPRVIRDRTPEKGLKDVSDLDFVKRLYEEQKKT